MTDSFFELYSQLSQQAQRRIITYFHNILMWRGKGEEERLAVWDGLVDDIVEELEKNGVEVKVFN